MNRFIFVSPSNSSTGGPTLLHQAAFKLKNRGIDTYMYYFDQKKGSNPVHDKFTNYNLSRVGSKKEILPSDTLILPEQYNIMLHCAQFENKKILWWLSVDNFLVSRFYSKLSGKIFKFLLNTILKSIKAKVEVIEIVKKISLRETKDLQSFSEHWVQSKYAERYVTKKGLKAIYVGDYLTEEFFETNQKGLNKIKQNIVCYNPSKGFKYTSRLIKHSKDINFIPIKDMTPSEVKALLNKSKVYIDLGNHPGQDRIPREARTCGCIVLVAKRGSANNRIDVPIDESYKFNILKNQEYLRMISLIEEIFKDYDKHLKSQDLYLNIIKNQEKKFEEDLLNAINQHIKNG